MGSLLLKFCSCSSSSPPLPSSFFLPQRKFRSKTVGHETLSNDQNKLERESPGVLLEAGGILGGAGVEGGKEEVKLDDFVVERELGRGGFGKVLKVRRRGKVYAMKVVRKKDIVENCLEESMKLEKMVLQRNSHPFVVKLNYSFQTKNKVYLVMEYMAGGDLFKLLQKNGKFTEETARLYLSEVILAIDYLHRELNLIYRDLKPENILLDAEGHIKLTDFGLSKQTDQTYTFAGTQEYLAPEVILEKGQTKAIDWWGCGVLLYEMLSGAPPFGNKEKNFEVIKRQILENRPRFPVYFSYDAISLIKKFMVIDPSKRLGSRSILDLKKDNFFKKIDWEKLMERKIDPPTLGGGRKDFGGREGVGKQIEETFDDKAMPYIPNMTYS